jgi:hypothetical protein
MEPAPGRGVGRRQPEEVPMLPATTRRVERHTADEINRRIQNEISERVRYYADHPSGIDARLAELDREWDIERTLEANAASFGLTGVLLGAFVDRRFLALPALVSGFLLQHALQGWCPPVPFFRSRGVRTTAEINQERSALKALRGDYANGASEPTTAPAARAEAALRAARA